jgi:DNA-directed RNA polymerase I subunit RPA1
MEEDEDNIFAKSLQQIVDEDPNADAEQLRKMEEKEDLDLDDDDDRNEIVKSLSHKAINLSTNIEVRDFSVDSKKHMWCCIKFELPVKYKNIDLTNVLRDAAKASVIWEVPKIKRAITFKQNDVLCVKTDGINIEVNIIKIYCPKIKFTYLFLAGNVEI